MFTNTIRAALAGAAELIGNAGAPDAQAVDDSAGLMPHVRPAPGVSLDQLQAGLRELATARDEGTIQDRLGGVIAGLDAQAPLVCSPFEITYIWLIVKLQALCGALEHRVDTERVVETVNTLANELADALAA